MPIAMSRTEKDVPSTLFDRGFEHMIRTAYHEGGHLVAHLLYRGAHIHQMTIVPYVSEGTKGPEPVAGSVNSGSNYYPPLVLFPPEQRDRQWREMRDRLKELAAGIVAERYHTRDAYDVHAAWDKEDVARMLAQFLGTDATAECVEVEWLAAERAVKADFDLLGGEAFFDRVASAIANAQCEADDENVGDEIVWIEGEIMDRLIDKIEGLLAAAPKARTICSALAPEGWRP